MKLNYNNVKPLACVKDMINDQDKKNTLAFRYISGKEEKSLTYGELFEKTIYLGTALMNKGYSKKRISCIGKNSFSWALVYLTTLTSDNVFVPVDKELPADDIINVINHSEADILFCDKKYVEPLNEKKEKFLKDIEFVVFDDESNSFEKLVEEGKELYENGDLSFKNLEPNPVTDLKMILYTSGTTGLSKGVMLSEKNIISCVYYGLRMFNVHESCLSVLPYHHSFESVCGILVSLHFGSTICINSDLKEVTRNLKRFKPGFIEIVPAFAELFYRKIIKNIQQKGKEKGFKILLKVSKFLLSFGIDIRKKAFKEIHEVFGGNLKLIVCGGAALRPEIGRFFNDIGITTITGYGITECSPLVSGNPPYCNDPVTVGFPLECVEVKIDNPSADGIGEIVVKGDTVMLGYYKAPELTDEVLKDGWFYTGDYGKFNKKGQLIITGRKKNMIVLNNGKNVFPEELEDYISGIEGVKEVLVYSKKDEKGIESGLTAIVYPDEEAKLTEDEIKHHITAVLSHLPVYKQIQNVVLRNEPFEKTTTNKIKRQNYIN